MFSANRMYSGDSSDQLEDEEWIGWFTSLPGNGLFCEVDKAYIEDSFNLTGLKQCLPGGYDKALGLILDKLDPNEPETKELSHNAALLYGLIHARYIITQRGLECMQRKYEAKEFGECSRMLCKGQAMIPMGCATDPKCGAVKLFCPKCRNVFNCEKKYRHIDGAYFGPTFPNFFFMNFEEMVPEISSEQYIPKVFGFRVNEQSKSIPKIKNIDAEADTNSSSNPSERREKDENTKKNGRRVTTEEVVSEPAAGTKRPRTGEKRS